MGDQRIEVVVRVRPPLPKETSPLRNQFTVIPLKKRSDVEEEADTTGFAGFDDVLLEGAGQPEVSDVARLCEEPQATAALLCQLEHLESQSLAVVETVAFETSTLR